MLLYIGLLTAAFLACFIYWFFFSEIIIKGKIFCFIFSAAIAAGALFLLLLPVTLIGGKATAEAINVKEYPINKVFEDYYVWYTKDEYIIATPNKTFNVLEKGTIITYDETSAPTLTVYTIGVPEENKWWIMFDMITTNYEITIPPNTIKFLPS